MQNSGSQWPFNWDEYEQGRSPRQGSIGSTGSRVQFEEGASTGPLNRLNASRPDDPNAQSSTAVDTLRRRRSSLSVRLASAAQAGGPNSIENFARSWSRAANFIDITQRPSLLVPEEPDESVGSRRSGDPPSPAESRGLLRQQLERQEAQSSVAVDEENAPLLQEDDETLQHRETSRTPSKRPSGIFDRASYLSSPLASSFGGTYGSFPSKFREPSRGQIVIGQFDAQSQSGVDLEDEEQERLLVKVVENEDGTKFHVIVGQSTLPQTVFNSINVLIGVGLLSLPLAFKQSGWLLGTLFLIFAAITTRYTGGLLAKCLDVDQSLITFSDLAWKAFGPRVRIAVGLLFALELVTACVALVILFADSLNALFPSLSIIKLKILCGIVLIPLSFVPLRYLSFTSVVGILSCLGIVTLVFMDGFIKPHFPGSLRDPAPTYLLPERWSDLPLSLGLLLSPWGGHSVFPNIYRDMRHPYKYPRAINYTYIFTSFLDAAFAVAGYLMFGSQLFNELTSNIFVTKGYPDAIAVIIIVFISIIPITKLPLNARPIIVVAEALTGLNAAAAAPPSTTDKPTDKKSYMRHILKGLIRVALIAIITVLAIIVPGFDTVMGLLGSAMAFSICIILPLAFNLKIFHHQLPEWERWLNWFLIVICSIMAIIGTVWVFLPKKMRHRLDGF